MFLGMDSSFRWNDSVSIVIPVKTGIQKNAINSIATLFKNINPRFSCLLFRQFQFQPRL